MNRSTKRVTTTTEPAIPAAGAVLWRQEGHHERLIALVHRPRYDDWTLPKGKLIPGEYPLIAAVREIAEETGSLVQVQRRLAPVEYLVGGARKRVQYWVMRHLSGDHEPSEEVNAIRWLPAEHADKLLSYPLDRQVLADFASQPPATGVVLLMRHAKAGKRSEYRGEDRLRPLDKIGRRQARDAVPVLAAFGPTGARSADRLRCEQTVGPLAARLGLEIESAPEFSDDAYALDPGPALKAVRALGRSGTATVICSQGDAIPGLLNDLPVPIPTSVSGSRTRARKGSIWALSFLGDTVVAADYYSHPGA